MGKQLLIHVEMGQMDEMPHAVLAYLSLSFLYNIILRSVFFF